MYFHKHCYSTTLIFLLEKQLGQLEEKTSWKNGQKIQISSLKKEIQIVYKYLKMLIFTGNQKNATEQWKYFHL